MYKQNFTASEWQTILFTPLWAFSAVAGSDGKVDSKEATALAKELAEASLYRDEFAREVLSAIAEDLTTVMPAYIKDTRKILDGLKEAADLLDRKMPGGAANGFKRAILGICIETAKADSGGGLHRPGGDNISNEEKAAIAIVATVLRIPIPSA